MSDSEQESLVLRQALAYEARVTEAHIEGYARVSRRLATDVAGIVRRLRGAALDEPLIANLRRRVLRQEARAVEALLGQASLPASRRRICAEQAARMRAVAEGGETAAYASTRRFGSSLEQLLAERR